MASIIREIGQAPQDLSAIDFKAEANTAIGMTDDGRAYLWRLSEGRGESAEAIPDVLPGSRISPSGEVLILMKDGGLSLQEVETGDIKLAIDWSGKFAICWRLISLLMTAKRVHRV